MIIPTTPSEPCDVCGEAIEGPHTLWLLVSKRLRMHAACANRLGQKLRGSYHYYQHHKAAHEAHIK